MADSELCFHSITALAQKIAARDVSPVEVCRHHSLQPAKQAVAEAMERYPRIFRSSYSAVVTAGQESGELPECLERLAASLEWRDETMKTIRGRS